VAGEGDGTRRRRAGVLARVVGLAGGLGVAVGECALLDHAALHAFRGNSDGATVVLEGQWMNAGHLALSGWDLSLDSFWTLDALFYAAAVRLVGVRGALLTAVPSVIALLVIVVGIALLLVGRRSVASGIGGGALLLGVLALPANNLAYVLLQGPWHIATALDALGAFWALARPERAWRVAIATVLLAAGLLGDTQSILLGLLPVLGASVVAVARCRSWRAGSRGAISVGGAVVLALVVREVARAAGTFAIATGYPKAHAKQLPANFAHIASWGASLFGHGSLPTIAMDNGSRAIDVVRVVEIVIVGAGVLWAVGATLAGALFAHRSPPGDQAGWRIDDLLVFGVVGDLALFVGLTPNDNGNYARYLTAAVIFGTILAARTVARLLEGVPSRAQLAGAAVAVAILGASGLAFGSDLSVPAATQSDLALVHLLEANGLRHGLGDYWSASITTVESADRVEVRPVITDPTRHLVRYGRQSAANWYQGVPFTFVVFDLGRPWRRVDATTAIGTFGKPARTLSVGTYRVLVWDHPLVVSTVGYSRK
jgi:hypothetical protein